MQNLVLSDYIIILIFVGLGIWAFVATIISVSKNSTIKLLKEDVEDMKHDYLEMFEEKEKWYKKWSNKSEQSDRLEREKGVLKEQIVIKDTELKELRSKQIRLHEELNGKTKEKFGSHMKAVSTGRILSSEEENKPTAKRASSYPSRRKDGKFGNDSTSSSKQKFPTGKSKDA